MEAIELAPSDVGYAGSDTTTDEIEDSCSANEEAIKELIGS